LKILDLTDQFEDDRTATNSIRGIDQFGQLGAQADQCVLFQVHVVSPASSFVRAQSGDLAGAMFELGAPSLRRPDQPRCFIYPLEW
jgi:hypothetical protein